MSAKPRGRPPAEGNFIVWTEHLVAALLRLRFDKYAAPIAAARGTKALRQAWSDMAEELKLQNDGGVVSVEQCRNKLKALKSKWLSYHAGVASEPVCLALMDSLWGGEGLEHRKLVKKPRLASASASGSTSEPKPPVLLAPAPVSNAESETAAPSVPVVTSTPSVVAASTSTSASLDGVEAAMANASELLSMGAQTMSQELSDIASTITEAARPKDDADLLRLIDDRFAKVIERQDKQLRLTEVQNQLLARLLAKMESGHDDQTKALD